MERYDLIVVGSGPGGYIAAERAGKLGKKVLLIEDDHLGGVCTNHGCIPTKSLLGGAKLYKHALNGSQFGLVVDGARFDYRQAAAHKDETVKTLRGGIEFLMKSAKVDVVFGHAKMVDAHTVQVGEKSWAGDYLIIATGSSSLVPPIPGATLPHVLTSTEILALSEAPASLVVIGGGVIGVEFASFFSMIGTKVTVIEMMDEILPMADAEFAKLLRRELKDVDFHLGCKVEEITAERVIYSDKKGERQSIEAPMVLLSVGRRPNTAGLEALGLEIGRGGVVVNDRMQTNLSTVYAVGDVTGRSLLAHSASRMAEVAVANIFGSKEMRMRYDAIPWAVYGSPEVAGCGLTESEANAKGIPTMSQTVQMRASGRFLAEEGKRAGGLVKVIANKESGVIVGIHLLGSYASEIIWGAAALIEAELRVKDVKEIVFPHPSVNELIKEACFQLDHSL
ncbi:MAG TPA: dihydrolipoyl dehydrogenase [Sphaerochaeta sp.]|jgi:dihydrolipoamide dehydrogenase|nr:dihydrolipoyl dehydrogenase [Spirochaetales bacterium]HOE84228.1 dihydrolipoyl dehydrogenase [Sphaerochaeta sp.]HOQ94188.1 dihydrolipoyl dehydrogenase [Sphaerochaeta sp.]HPK46205.1 dihydrolipoyl dehydrogenase [Sphaerochaeta sp.]HPY11743.1 dihydrolipoyl dehydrogenase [Sphaerochaeta sp.]